jgi:hypothetical protein
MSLCEPMNKSLGSHGDHGLNQFSTFSFGTRENSDILAVTTVRL